MFNEKHGSSVAAVLPHIVERIAELRKLNGLTLELLAQRASLTKSYLSKLERGLSSPTLATVGKLAAALEVSVDQLIGAAAHSSSILIVKSQDRVPFSPSANRNAGTYEAIGVQRKDKMMRPFVMRPPLSLADNSPMACHAGEELIFVVSGEMDVMFADRQVRLCTGDSLYFNASIPHCTKSVGPLEAQALVVISDPKNMTLPTHSTVTRVTR